MAYNREMNKALNIPAVQSAMEQKGLNQSTLAEQLDVNRQNVSKWFNGAVPRPNIALSLALLLDLSFDELFEVESRGAEPVVAFRKKAGREIAGSYIEKAKDRGHALKSLVEYLPFDSLYAPDEFREPVDQYEYVQQAVLNVRQSLDVEPDRELTLDDLIKNFCSQQAVLIPVLWGAKEHHENALHIYLPDSKSTWIFINLDAEYLDFKFWLAHELAHAYTPSLVGDAAENFADSFAGALLFPGPLAEDAYNSMNGDASGVVVNKLKSLAERYKVSPITIYYQILAYCKSRNLRFNELGNGIFGAARNLNKNFEKPSELWKVDSPASLIRAGDDNLKSPFFSVLKDYLQSSGKESSYIASLMDLSLVDAKSVQLELG